MTPADRKRHATMLALAAGAMMTAAMLKVCPDGRVALRFLPDHPLPHTCGTQILFDSTCPGCGLTRSFIYLARADWREAHRAHRIGGVLALAVLIQLPYRAVALARGQNHPLGESIPRIFGYTLVFLLIANWTIGLFR